jgi:hypothetical protein
VEDQFDLNDLLPAQKWFQWACSIVPTLVMLFAGVLKLMPPEEVKEASRAIGVDEMAIWWLGVGILVMVALYWLPRTALLGTILLTGYLGGAAAIHVFVAKTSPALPVMLGILFWAGFCLRYPRVIVAAGLIRGGG